MYGIVKDKSVIQIIPIGVAFELDGVNYPSNWLEKTTEEERQKLGIYEVLPDADARDSKYYNKIAEPVYQFDDKTNTITTTIEKSPKLTGHIVPNYILAIKGHAQSLITGLVMGDPNASFDKLVIKQLNILARMAELQRKGEVNLNGTETTELSIVTTMWTKIKAIRAYSNQLETDVENMTFEELIAFDVSSADWPT